MAEITFIYRSKKETGNLSIRLAHGKEIDLRVSSKIISKKEYWFKRTTKNGKTKTIHIQLKDISNLIEGSVEHKEFLKKIKEQIKEKFIVDYNKGIPIEGNWLKKAVSKFSSTLDTKEKIKEKILSKEKKLKKKKEKKERIRIANLLSTAIEKMFIKYATNNSELKKYRVTLKVLQEFQQDQGQIFKIINFGQNFADLFMNWGLLIMKYQKSYINSQLGRIQSAVVNSYENDTKKIIKVSRTYRSVKGFKNEYKGKIVTILNYKELDIIEQTIIEDKELQDAKNAILIGCETGLRYSDMNKLIDDNINEVNGVKYWKFKMNKVDKIVKVVITDRIRYLIDKYGLPKTNYPSNEVKLNKDVKKVCELCNLNDKEKGSKSISVKVKGKSVRRNIVGIYPKHELVTTRTLRRSFATNYAGKIDINSIKTALGHATEAQTRAYINEENETNIILTKHQLDKFHENRNYEKQLEKEKPKMLVIKNKSAQN
jgi:integrase